jgi:alpha/beta superfamily hydrolase
MKIKAGEMDLEAVLWEPKEEAPRGAALLCHPHPLYGGTMNNRVIYRAAKGAVDAGFAALRFNFRGVGASSGSYDRGNGEKNDVAALMDWLERQYQGLPQVLVGFSFGAWVGLQVGCHDPRMMALVGLGPPLNSYDFDFLLETEKPLLLVAGTSDEHCPHDTLSAFSKRLPPAAGVRWVEGADHFFKDQLDQVRQLVRDFFLGQARGVLP